ncbi:hypothetical protein CO151_12105 [bacterium CG_4_9_14_3_um_filter_65_15]|nr:MAG: hypothetical protein CO151_12105 [bacterium CG_4_9_14_3_um_filter_65_15]
MKIQANMMIKARVMVGLFLFVLGACSSGQKAPAENAKPTVEVRLADRESRDGFTAMTDAGTGETISVSPEITLSNNDIMSAQAIADSEGGPAVEAVLNLLGTQKFAIFTSNHIGEMAAVIVNGQVVSAPVIRAPIMKGRVIISGKFTQGEAEGLARSLGGD